MQIPLNDSGRAAGAAGTGTIPPGAQADRDQRPGSQEVQFSTTEIERLKARRAELVVKLAELTEQEHRGVRFPHVRAGLAARLHNVDKAVFRLRQMLLFPLPPVVKHRRRRKRETAPTAPNQRF
jgi:hypothetical protein